MRFVLQTEVDFRAIIGRRHKMKPIQPLTALILCTLVACNPDNSSGNDASLLLLGAISSGQSSSASASQTCAQSAANPVSSVSEIGGVCATPVLVQVGDGTIRDTANNILWIQCAMDDDGSPGAVHETSPGSCQTIGASQVFSAATGQGLCSSLTYAGRTGWKLPDMRQLGAHFKNQAAAPHVVDQALSVITLSDATAYNYITTTTGSGSSVGMVEFRNNSGSGGGMKLAASGTTGIVTCMIKL